MMTLDDLLVWLRALPGDATIKVNYAETTYLEPAGVCYDEDLNVIHFFTMSGREDVERYRIKKGVK